MIGCRKAQVRALVAAGLLCTLAACAGTAVESGGVYGDCCGPGPYNGWRGYRPPVIFTQPGFEAPIDFGMPDMGPLNKSY